jgi:hypothetical protein
MKIKRGVYGFNISSPLLSSEASDNIFFNKTKCLNFMIGTMEILQQSIEEPTIIYRHPVNGLPVVTCMNNENVPLYTFSMIKFTIQDSPFEEL